MLLAPTLKTLELASALKMYAEQEEQKAPKGVGEEHEPDESSHRERSGRK